MTVGHLLGLLGPQSGWLQALSCAEAAGHWLAGSCNKSAGCGTPGGLGASTGSLVGTGGVQESPGLVLALWWVKQVLGLALVHWKAELVLESGCRAQGFHS